MVRQALLGKPGTARFSTGLGILDTDSAMRSGQFSDDGADHEIGKLGKIFLILGRAVAGLADKYLK